MMAMHARRFWVSGIVLAATIALLPFSFHAERRLETATRVEGSQAEIVRDELAGRFHSPFVDRVVLVIEGLPRADSEEGGQALETIVAALREQPGVSGVVSYLELRDPVPLLRLVAEAIDGEDTGGPPNQFSTGLEVAVECADYKQLYNMRDEGNARHTQYLARLSATEANDPGLYAPFTLPEALGGAGLGLLERPAQGGVSVRGTVYSNHDSVRHPGSRFGCVAFTGQLPGLATGCALGRTGAGASASTTSASSTGLCGGSVIDGRRCR